MADRRQPLSDLLALFADNEIANISAQDLRDFLVSCKLNNAVTKTSNYTADADDAVILVDGTSSTVEITLPTATADNTHGKSYVIKCINLDNACTIATNGSETIDGAASYSFVTVNDTLEIASDGTDWVIVSNYLN